MLFKSKRQSPLKTFSRRLMPARVPTGKRKKKLMNNSTTDKQLAMIARVSPAFSINDMVSAHAALDTAGVPRKKDETLLTLTERIRYLHGQVVSARKVKSILIVCGRRSR
jgi:hypothetical protein